MDIRKRRLELGYETQTAFAKATGISLGSVSQVENHVVLIANMPDERKKVWAEALKLPIGELTKDDDKRRHERCVFPCKTYKVDKEDLERQLKERWGDKIGEVREEKSKGTGRITAPHAISRVLMIKKLSILFRC
jgi:transcriptional regulator with XRE-family HTH domain